MTRALALVRPAIPSQRRMVGIGLLALVMAVAFWVSSVVQPDWFGDADWYASALPAVHGNAPLYDPIMLAPHVAERPVHFNLPPAMALLAPIAGMGRLPWGLLMLSSLLLGLALVWPRLRPPWDLVVFGAVVASIPFQSAVIYANVNSLIVLLLAVAIRWPKTAGTAIGIATALKVAPVFAFAWLIGRRDWNGLGIGIAVAAGLTIGAALLIDPAALVNFWIVRWNELPRQLPLAPSLNSLGLPPVVGYVAAMILAMIAAYRASLLLAVLACLVAVPQLHAHYWVWLLIPILARGRPVLEGSVERMREFDWSNARPVGEAGS